jgi:hypothetical protein
VLHAEVPADQDLTIRAQQIGRGGVPLSVAETRFAAGP